MENTGEVSKNTLHQRAWRERLKQDPEKRKLYDRQKYLRNKGKYAERSKAWTQNNRHKSQASVHQHTVFKKYPETEGSTDITVKELAVWVDSRRGTPCPYCGGPAFHIDHINPLARGGLHTWSNIEMICKTCNFAKNNLNKEEFLAWIKALAIRWAPKS